MNEKQLERMYKGKGFIAALDQSGGSTPKALANYGVTSDEYKTDEEMFTLMHAMRTRIIKSSAFSSDHILGAILFENTMERKIDDLYTADYLWQQKHIVPFLKIDKGLREEKDGVQLMKDMPQLDELLQKAVKYHIFGTKMRSVIKKADAKGIKDIVDQQFEVGKKIASYGLVPILEPEVDIFSADKATSEKLLKEALLEGLKTLESDTKIIFKVSIPTENNFYAELMDDPHVVRVVALSGGYSRDEANKKLSQNHGLIASFSRALTEGLNVHQNQAFFDQTLGTTILEIYKASIQ